MVRVSRHLTCSDDILLHDTKYKFLCVTFWGAKLIVFMWRQSSIFAARIHTPCFCSFWTNLSPENFTDGSTDYSLSLVCQSYRTANCLKRAECVHKYVYRCSFIEQCPNFSGCFYSFYLMNISLKRVPLDLLSLWVLYRRV